VNVIPAQAGTQRTGAQGRRGEAVAPGDGAPSADPSQHGEL